MQIKIKKLRDNATLPMRGSNYAAGWDVTAAIDKPITIYPGHTTKIGTGLAMELPEGYYIAVQSRSGLATKRGLRVAQGTGICDSDYRGEYIVPLYNDSKTIQVINPGERIAQIILQQYAPMEFEVVDILTDTTRGEGGFGSTGK